MVTLAAACALRSSNHFANGLRPSWSTYSLIAIILNGNMCVTIIQVF